MKLLTKEEFWDRYAFEFNLTEKNYLFITKGYSEKTRTQMIFKNELFGGKKLFFQFPGVNGDILNLREGIYQLNPNYVIKDNNFEEKISVSITDFIRVDTDNIKINNAEIPIISEIVNSPSHYKGKKLQVIDIIEEFDLGFKLGNAIKYILRAGKKDKLKFIEDLQKAIWYLNREIENVSNN